MVREAVHVNVASGWHCPGKVPLCPPLASLGSEDAQCLLIY